jgi:hypothetical protein
MTTQNLRLKIASPSLRLSMRPIYPLKLVAGTGIGLFICERHIDDRSRLFFAR